MATPKTEALKGNERIQQLMEEFPEIPRILVVKADALREGICPNEGSRLIGRWALPDAHWYFEYDKEDVHTAEETREGYTLSPVACHFSNGVTLQPMFDSRSPYEFHYEEKGRYRLYRDGEPIEEVFFTSRPQWYDLKTSSGKPMSSIIPMRSEGMMKPTPLTYCEYGKDNLTCKYCNINPSETTKKGLGMERQVSKRDEDIYETLEAIVQEGLPSHTTFGMSGGVILDSSKEAEVYVRMAKALRRAMKDVGQEFPISATCQAMAAEDQMRLKEAGISTWRFNLEVWDPRLFEIICPGKAKYVGRQRWIDRILQIVEFAGSTSTSMVLGVEMAQPYGFKTEDEAAQSVLEGWEWLLAHKVSPGATFFRPAPGTEFAGQTPPRTEYFLRMSLANYQLHVEYDMVPKRGRPSGIGIGIAGDFPHVDLPGASGGIPSAESGPRSEVC